MASKSDLEDLLGEDPSFGDPNEPLDVNNQKHWHGVSISWLASVFRHDKYKVKSRMRALEPVKYVRKNVPLYDIAEAAAYLVRPKYSMTEILKTLKPEELPNEMQTQFWDARLKQRKYEELVGELWRGEDVVATYGETFKQIKEAVQLWQSDVEEKYGLTKEQRALLIQSADDLLEAVHRRLVASAKANRTPNVLTREQEEGDVSDD